MTEKNNKTKNILTAFLLNISFSIAEFFGGMITGSAAIMSDSIHDLGDALSIGISYYLERKSEKIPDKTFTYGYSRYSILGATITSLILFIGSLFMIGNAVYKLCNPVEIDFDGMIILAILGFFINLIAVVKTSGGESLNEKAVNLHMIEDAVGWLIVLIGGFVMKYTGWVFIDPILSLSLSLFILYNVGRNLREIIDIFLMKVPKELNIEKIEEEIKEVKDVKNISNLHIWRLDEDNICGSVCVDGGKREEIREVFIKHGINYSVIEIENTVKASTLVKNHRHIGCMCHKH